jgi:hypothetical protein
MGASRHTEAQIIAALKQVEAGRSVEDVGREYGVSINYLILTTVDIKNTGAKSKSFIIKWFWYREGDLNPHNSFESADFKSAASASFAMIIKELYIIQ